MSKPPNSRRNLDLAIQRISGPGDRYVHVRTMLANAIVGQMLPPSVIKGGTALKMRYGDFATRFTTDLDTARRATSEDFLDELEMNLRDGWNGFTGHIVARQPAHPDGVPPAYIMQPYDIKLAYNGKAWVTVPLEIGHNEIGDADEPEMVVPVGASKILQELGFPEAAPVPLMRLDHQIAQKLHALSSPGLERVHDLVDLQLIVQRDEVDMGQVRAVCLRLFSYRRAQGWPPHIEKNYGWDDAYAESADGLSVIGEADEAIAWGNSFIAEIDQSK